MVQNVKVIFNYKTIFFKTGFTIISGLEKTIMENKTQFFLEHLIDLYEKNNGLYQNLTQYLKKLDGNDSTSEQDNR